MELLPSVYIDDIVIMGKTFQQHLGNPQFGTRHVETGGVEN